MKCLIKSFPHFSTVLCVSFLEICSNYLYNQNRSLLTDICIINITLGCGLTFTILAVAFYVQKLLLFISFNLSFFPLCLVPFVPCLRSSGAGLFFKKKKFPSLSQNSGCSRRSQVAEEEGVRDWFRGYSNSSLLISEATTTSSTANFVLNQALPCQLCPTHGDFSF